jgi:hypothetical protein
MDLRPIRDQDDPYDLATPSLTRKVSHFIAHLFIYIHNKLDHCTMYLLY